MRSSQTDGSAAATPPLPLPAGPLFDRAKDGEAFSLDRFHGLCYYINLAGAESQKLSACEVRHESSCSSKSEGGLR